MLIWNILENAEDTELESHRRAWAGLSWESGSGIRRPGQGNTIVWQQLNLNMTDGAPSVGGVLSKAESVWSQPPFRYRLIVTVQVDDSERSKGKSEARE